TYYAPRRREVENRSEVQSRRFVPRHAAVGFQSVGLVESLKFGDEFELDLRAYELRRAGSVVRLERIPMELLLLLIENRGQLVTREQILERIWGKDVFLDCDNSINAAVRKARQALKDDPEHPRFIQTVTGKGYRFIATVVGSGAPEAEPEWHRRRRAVSRPRLPPGLRVQRC